MKKTITITIGGRPFIIEEDGYITLDQYLKQIRKTFITDVSVDELIADMESSISEKMQERLSKQVNVITRDHIEEIIGIMGKPEEIVSDEPNEQINDQKTETKQKMESEHVKKRLYRDTDDVVVAGVASGIAAYLGIDPVFVRIAFIILTISNGIGILIYLALWVSLPKAETTAQKYEMRGKTIDFQELKETIKEKSKVVADEGKVMIEELKKPDSKARSFFRPFADIIQAIGKGFIAIIRVFVPIFLVVFGITLLLASALGIAGTITAGFIILLNPTIISLATGSAFLPLLSAPLFGFGIIALLFTALIPLFFLLMLGSVMIQRKNVFSAGFSMTLMLFWIFAIIVSAVIFFESFCDLSMFYALS